VVAHGDARAKAVEAEWKGKLAEQKANYERRLTRAGGSQ
jgi:predicted SprT family Zn-dependent metalloprotease